MYHIVFTSKISEVVMVLGFQSAEGFIALLVRFIILPS